MDRSLGRSFFFALSYELYVYKWAALAVVVLASGEPNTSCALLLRFETKIEFFSVTFQCFLEIALRGAGKKVTVCATRGEL
jgi:hypothetical protein